MDILTNFRPDLIDPSVFLAPGVHIVGNVSIAGQSSVWFNSVIRGDTEEIVIGEQTNIQDLSMIHADPGWPTRIGDRVTVGHSTVVHGAIVDNEVMIGMRAVLLNGARIGSGSIIGAGTLVTEKTEVPPNSLVLGTPGKVVRELSERLRKRILHAAEHYVAAAAAYRLSQETNTVEKKR